MPGPAPKPDWQRRRANATLPTTRLPAGGRQGDPPEWPLPRASRRERALWARVWSTPQAVMWELKRWPEIIARYVRLLARTERAGCPLTVHAEVSKLEDRLGLTDMAMARLRWTIDNESDPQQDAGPDQQGLIDIRQRLQAVDAS